MVGRVGRPVVAVALVVVVLCGAGGVAGAAAPPADTAASGALPATTDDTPGPGTARSAAAPDGPVVAPLDLPSPVASDAALARDPSTDATVTRIRLQADGTAIWTVEIRTLLENDTDLAAYEGFQVRFRNDTGAYLGSFRDRMTGLVERAANVTGREMTARNFTASTSIDRSPRRWGVVTYRFRWEGFAELREDGLVVGDVFESGYYLAGSDSLVIEAPQGYVVSEATPAPTTSGDLTVRWAGPIDFGDGRPSVRVRLAGTQTPATSTGPADGGTDSGGTDPGRTGDDDGGGSGASGLLPALALGAVLLFGGVGAYVVLGRRGGGAGTVAGPADAGADDPGGTPASAGDATAGGSGDGAGATGGSGESDAGPGAAGADPEEGEGPGAGGPTPVPDEDLLTDEERVVALLEGTGGRMRQADIADELDWSAPKTSRVLSSMDDDGAIDKLRLGNENVIDLPDED